MKMSLKLNPTLLPALVAFECVARHASFSRAAEELGVSASALSQSVRSLERRLNVRLLARTTRRVGLTEEGAAMLDGVREGLAQLGGALDTVEHSRSQPAGMVRITLPRMAFARFFLPRLAEFSARYPEVGVEFALDDHLVDLVAEGFDVGVRMGEQIAADMVALPLGRVTRLVTVAAPAYFAQRPVPDSPDALAGHECSRYRYATSGRLSRWLFQRDGQPLEVDVSGRYIINDLAAEIDLARSGQALVQTVESMVAEDLRSGRLVPVLDAYALPLGSLYLYFPSRVNMPPRLRVFIDHFKA
ncbi:LysR family transcriptional regulator [Denitromonas ohlonensis]|uniref:LysR family transcriptional regulator n=3 Tax=Denitromonas TaxID=139331 RepID=A0A557RHY2_9RHOO|nr:LysR family transcriptional regulator [Denitromonas ohlonensis]TVO70370.1 LysR family transcriptional regulator [Denitromonas ohlonensis]